MYVLCLIFAISLGFAFQDETPSDLQRKADEVRQQAIELNELAGRIESEALSETLVNNVAEMFKSELPPAWATSSVRQQVARAEYKSATDVSYLIPEDRIAEGWNEYVREIGAPDEAIVTAEEIHNMRDADYASGQMLWKRNLNQSVWTMPNIAAVGPDRKVAKGCRALEAIRLLYSMDRLFENVRSARKRVSHGIVASDEIATRPSNSRLSLRVAATLRTSTDTNPLRPAEQKYIRAHGPDSFNLLLARLFGKLFPHNIAQ